MSELRIVLDTRRGRSAPGADGLPFHTLGNSDAAQLPSLWRSSTVSDAPAAFLLCGRRPWSSPCSKSGKPAGSISSYLPISLTSVVGKTLQPMALRRFEWIGAALETFAPEQSGFRRLHSVADSLFEVAASSRRRWATRRRLLILLDVQGVSMGFLMHHHWSPPRAGCLTGRLPALHSRLSGGRPLRVRVGGPTE
ncbi:hypothetical protein HPB49_007688 [Dermacentor silvarum]|uniref:Uncharacterized protein n=1 Tax=Dermacentor silvarum TaxID=543639 RepID=A0ACB8D3Q8_DERSI|nr:hypothetical protein HPB49_007688 [Dermacentor silvarum]